MKIIVITTFLEGRDRFEKDDRRTVTDEDGARFIANGWAVKDGDAVPTDPLSAIDAPTLDVHDGQHGQEASHG